LGLIDVKGTVTAMKRLALLLLAVLVPAASLAAAPNPRYAGPEGELNRLRQEVAAAKLDRLLNLTRDQARALQPVLKEAVQLQDLMRVEHEKRRPDIAKALASVRDDYLKVGTVSEASRKGLQDARGDAALKETKEKMRLLHQRVREILTPEQKGRLHEFNANPLDEREGGSEEMGQGFGGRHGHGGGDGEHGARHGKAMKVAISPEFSALVDARAR
jgi:Spy/CpxP family protein refolding chaperone